MMRACVLILLMAAACSGPAPAVTFQATPGATPSGGYLPLGWIVVDETNVDRPIAGVTVSVYMDAGGSAHKTVQTDAAGRAEIEYLAGKYLRIESTVPGYVGMRTTWLAEVAKPINNNQHRLAMKRAVPVGGRVVDENGQPVAGACVTARIDEPQIEDPDFSPCYDEQITSPVFTDAQGQWRCDSIPYAKPDDQFYLKVEHPDYLPMEGIGRPSSGNVSTFGVEYFESLNYAEFCAGRGETVLKRPAGIKVYVRDKAGNFIRPAVFSTVGKRKLLVKAKSVASNEEQGFYIMDRVPRGKQTVVVWASGYEETRFEPEFDNPYPVYNIVLKRR